MIKKLDSNLINQIAAGEVVDDPKSIIKELIENSIDANSTKIEIFLTSAGMKKITISDNGIGIKEDQLKLAFERFATSKISHIEDLTNVHTLGFRGEALPSIASVCDLTLKSKSNSEDIGSEIIYRAGKFIKIIPSDIESGTSIEVKNLFYNVPARKKFLKSENYEFRKILKLFKSIALSHPKIGFLLNHNDKQIYKLKPDTLINRIQGLFGQEVSDGCIKVDYKKDDYHIQGYIGNLSLVKKRRGNQHLFINNRSIVNQFVNLSIYNSYQSLIERGEYPYYILFITVPGDSIDVNVHPKKEEVKFKNDLQIQHIVKKAISEKLKHFMSMIPSYKQFDFSNKKATPEELQFSENSVINTNILALKSNKYDEDIKNAELRISKNVDDNTDVSVEINNIWQIHNKYIITEITSGVIIVDQHVAHERVLYEIAKKSLEGDGMKSQKILFPKTIKFENEDFTYVKDILSYLEQIGFELREFSDNSLIIEGVPSDLPFGRESEVIYDILDHYIKTKSTASSFIEYMAATYACKAAIKAGDKLDQNECKSLIDQLFSTEHPYYCPHGRPIIVNLTIDDLDKRFERH